MRNAPVLTDTQIKKIHTDKRKKRNAPVLTDARAHTHTHTHTHTHNATRRTAMMSPPCFVRFMFPFRFMFLFSPFHSSHFYLLSFLVVKTLVVKTLVVKKVSFSLHVSFSPLSLLFSSSVYEEMP